MIGGRSMDDTEEQEKEEVEDEELEEECDN